MWASGGGRQRELLQACPNGRPCQPCRFCHLADPTASEGASFHRGPEATCTFIQEWLEDDKLCCDSLCHRVLHSIDHNTLI